MATLNLSVEGASINRSYQTVVETPLPSGSATSSPTYAQWALFSVAAPLVSAFQQDSGKESVLKVQGSGDGELSDLIDEFSDGKIQFAFLKVKDPNTTLAKSVLIAWCGEGVPERTKGYFTSHLAAVAKLLHGYHVQVTARTDADLTPENIIRKVADASGSKYSGDNAPAASSPAPPPIASKPVFTPTQVGGGSTGFNPLGSRSRAPVQAQKVDSDGWGADAPPVTRSQLEKVQPAYQPTKVNMAELTSQKPGSSQVFSKPEPTNGQSDVVKGGYQPIGKVDIAALRRDAQQSSSTQDDRPTVVKGSYEPVGKVDIAAIRARAQPSAASPPPSTISPSGTGNSDEPKSLADRSAAFAQPERLTTLPKPKVANKFGANTGSFTGTKAPTPGGIGSTPVVPSAPPVGLASKTFADEGGKTPAQIWAEKKARERGSSGAAETARPIVSQTSGSGGWESGYGGKKWAPVQTTRTGQSAGNVSEQRTGEEPAVEEEPIANVSAMRDKFKGSAPMGAPSTTSRLDVSEPQDEEVPPPMDLSSKPNAARGVPIPGITPQAPPEPEEEEEEEQPPVQPPRDRTPSPSPPSSPIRIAQPVGRGQDADVEPLEEDRFSPPPAPAKTVSQPPPSAPSGGKRAVVQFDYEKAEDNEIDLAENETITDIDQVDEDWWLATNSKGERGLFPANYVELIDDDDAAPSVPAPAPVPAAAPAAPAAPAAKAGKSATAMYDYDAAEDNEISFAEGQKITNIEFPDEDWWFGMVNGKEGLFPGVYVQLDN